MVRSTIDDASSTPTDERRASVRQVSDWNGYCEPMGARTDQLWCFARVHDLSVHGIGLLLRQRFEPGTLLFIEVANPASRLAQRFRAQVVRVCPEPDGWLVGCVFDNVLEGK